jgi:putative heme-binding domain-containing protein
VIVRARLADADPFVRRAAAEALAAHPAIESVEPLLRCWAEASTEDVQLVHAVRIALRKQLVTATPEQLAGLVAKGEDAPRLAEILVTVPGDVAAWRAFELVRAAGAPVAAWSNALVAVAAHCSDARRDDAARAARTACGDDLRLQEDVLRPLLQRRLLTAGGEFGRWAAAYAAAVLADGATPAPSDDTLRIAVSAVKSVGMSSAFDAVMRIARDAKRPPDLIESAAAAAVAADRDRARALALPVMGEVSEPFPVRIAFARVLGNEDSPDVRAAIGRGLKSSTASQQKDLAMVLLSRKEGAGLLLELIGAGKASAVLLQDGQVLEQLKKAGIDGLDERVKTLTAGMPAADRRIQQAIGKVAGQFHKAGGTAETGADLFTKHCAACHRFADRGGLVGPQLEGIGQRGAERLLEDILDPNRNVDEAFRTTTVALADGRVVSGLRLREEAADVVFADATGKEVRVPKVEIEETNTSRVSPMPANMLDQVGEGNLPHLLAYLMRQQAPAAP